MTTANQQYHFPVTRMGELRRPRRIGRTKHSDGTMHLFPRVIVEQRNRTRGMSFSAADLRAGNSPSLA